jgi:16S rRNA (guanine527-N7)-methyltransferase
MTWVRTVLAAGDLDRLIGGLHERAVWITAGSRPVQREGREEVSAGLTEERANGMWMDPQLVIDHEAVTVVEVRSDSGPLKERPLHRVIRVREDGVRRLEDFENRESALERAGRFALACPAHPEWAATLCEFFGVEDRERIEDLARLFQRPEVPYKYGFGRRELIADSLGALQVPGVREADCIADLGSGYGFPGLVLGAVLGADVSLVEMAPERCEFLRMAARHLGLRNVAVVEGRAENLANEAFDVVTVRNVAHLNTVVEWAAPHLRLGGTGLVWMSALIAPDPVAVADAAAAGRVTGLELRDVLPTHPWGHWYVLVFGKERKTPAQFPRSIKEARRDPITAGGR